jgi:Flp pilus assembly protein TadG
MRGSSPGRRRERGSLTLELAVVFPAVLAVLLLVVQTGLYLYARQVALDAARQGAEAARLRIGSLPNGITVAEAFARRAGAGSLLDPRTSATGSTQFAVRITVTGHAPSLLPGLGSWSISQTALAPTERFTQP